MKVKFLFSMPAVVAAKVKAEADKKHESVTAWILDAVLKKLGAK